MALGLTPVDLTQVNAAFERIFLEERSRVDGELLRVAQSNLLLPYSGDCRSKALQPLIDSLGLVHPGRFFLVRIEPGHPGISAAISAQCHSIAARQYFCSEIVQLTSSPENLRAVPSIILAHTAVGVPLEVFLYPEALAPDAARFFLPLADRILFDSGEFEQLLPIEQVLSSGKDLFDFEWIRCEPWRRVLAKLFELTAAQRLLPRLAQIEISGGSGPEGGHYGSGALMGGWLAARLELEVVARTASTSFWRSPRGLAVSVTLEQAASRRQLDFMRLVFGALGEEREVQILIERADDTRLQAKLDGQPVVQLELTKKSEADLAEMYYQERILEVSYNKALRKLPLPPADPPAVISHLDN